MHQFRMIWIPLVLSAGLVLGQTTASKTANTPIAEMANAVTVCAETQACELTAVSNTAAVFQFGAVAAWCQTFTNPTLPIAVSYTSANPALCAYDPAPNVVKTLVVQQMATAFTVTVTLDGTITVVPVPALAVTSPPATGPTPVSTFPALCTNYSDTSFKCVATGPVVAVVAK